MKRKIVSLLLVLCLFIPCLMLTGCNGGSLKTMNVSINPEISFVVDGNNKIVNVVLENEDAGTIYANVDFAGMKAEDAIKVVIEQSVISGHFTLTGDEVSVNVNGSVDADIEELALIAKNKINEVCSSLGVSVTVEMEQLSLQARKDALVAKALILAPEFTEEELEAKTESELVLLIKEKQEELKGLTYSQVESIKQAFGKAENLILKQIENLKISLSEKQALLDAEVAKLQNIQSEDLREMMLEMINQYKSAISSLEAQIDTLLENYETAKAQAIETAKTKYESLKASLVSAYNQQVANSKAEVLAHLDSKLASGAITQEKYDYWVALANGNN